MKRGVKGLGSASKEHLTRAQEYFDAAFEAGVSYREEASRGRCVLAYQHRLKLERAYGKYEANYDAMSDKDRERFDEWAAKGNAYRILSRTYQHINRFGDACVVRGEPNTSFKITHDELHRGLDGLHRKRKTAKRKAKR